jgi:anti-sigma regulatory factor (Ser/Thr protein kinase)
MAHDPDSEAHAIRAISQTANRLARRMGAAYELNERWRERLSEGVVNIPSHQNTEQLPIKIGNGRREGGQS